MSPSGAAQTTELLRHLIRNACVNDGRAESGQELRSVETLSAFLDGVGLDVVTFEPVDGRASLVARIEGSDPQAPSLCLMGHTDVVPANAAGWQHDPFGAELIDGEIWGRGAIDMLNLTASMAVAIRELANEGFQPKGDLIYLAVADEEAGGMHGARWLLDNEYESVYADYVITESGGLFTETPTGPKVLLTVGEKGIAWRRLTVRGTPGHGSRPFHSDNALVKAAILISRIANYTSRPQINDTWRQYVQVLDIPEELKADLVDPQLIDRACEAIEDRETAAFAHACTHMTFSPNVVHGGQKTNVIPDTVQIDVDVRILPGQSEADVDECLQEIFADLGVDVDVASIASASSTASPFDSPLRTAIQRVVPQWYPGAELIPRITTGATDASPYRQKGAIAYGFGLYSPTIDLASFLKRFHGNDERVDVASLEMTTDLWLELVHQFMS